jgi:hypothetical protein
VDWSDLLKRHDHRTHELEIYRIGYESSSEEVPDKVEFANEFFDSFAEQLTEYCSINEPTDEYDKERIHIVSLFGMCTNLPFHELPEDPCLLHTAGVTASIMSGTTLGLTKRMRKRGQGGTLWPKKVRSG